MDFRSLTPQQRQKFHRAVYERRDWCSHMLQFMDRHRWDQLMPEYQMLIVARQSFQAMLNAVGLVERLPPDPPKPPQVCVLPEYRSPLPPLGDEQPREDADNNRRGIDVTELPKPEAMTMEELAAVLAPSNGNAPHQ